MNATRLTAVCLGNICSTLGLAWPRVSKWDRRHIVSWKHWTRSGAAITLKCLSHMMGHGGWPKVSSGHGARFTKACQLNSSHPQTYQVCRDVNILQQRRRAFSAVPAVSSRLLSRWITLQSHGCNRASTQNSLSAVYLQGMLCQPW